MVKLTIAYEGTRYLGWQDNKHGLTVEAELKKALEQFLQHPVSLDAISRTDAGVHARGQVVYFETDRDLSRLQKSLNSMLPRDIAVLKVEEGSPEKPKSKIYRYRICNGPVQLPHRRHFSWHIRKPLDLDEMRMRADALVGKRDFADFANAKKENYTCTVRDLMRIDIFDGIIIEMEGDSFLYKMARNLVGRIVGEEVTAPAHGLTLEKIVFDESLAVDRLADANAHGALV